MDVEFTDQQLVELIQTGEGIEKAAECLMRDKQLQKRIYKTIRWNLKDKNYAEDVFMESILIAIKKIQMREFEDSSKLRAYIAGICKYVCLTWNRNLKYQKVTDGIDTAFKLSNNTDIMGQIIDADLLALLENYVQKLTSVCQSTLISYYWKMQSAKEIATASDISEQSVNNNLSRCREKLRELLRESEEIMAILKERGWKI